MRWKELGSLSLGCVLTLACGTGSDSAPPAEDAPTGDTSHDAEVHWGYGPADGPEFWGELSPDFSLCRDGRGQSPIDLRDATRGTAPAIRKIDSATLSVKQRANVLDLIDNGHTIQVTTDAPVSLDVEGEHFELVQYHFHTPSEHTINGKHSPLEVHFVHKSDAGRLAVVGILVEEGEHNAMFGPVISALPSGPGAERHIDGLDLDLGDLERLQYSYYRYEGSLTTPPCSEGVLWIVSSVRREFSSEQLAKLDSLLSGNNRPVQPLGDRDVELVSD